MLLPKQQSNFLFTSLYEGARQLEPTEENKKMVKGLCRNQGWDEEVRDYIVSDLGSDYID